MELDGTIYNVKVEEGNCIKLPQDAMDYLKVHENILLDFERIAPGVVIIKKGEPL